MSAAAQPLPVDVRLMNAVASLLYAAVAIAMAAAALGWAARQPLFAVTRIVVEGEVAHSSVATLRANVASRLSGNFLTVDLAQARDAFEDIPWVRRAVVRREFPNVLRVTLEEHRAVAFWGVDGGSVLVNSFGEVFEANPGDVEGDALPRLSGPEAQAREVLATWQAIAPLFEHLDLRVESLTLTGRGSWNAVLDTGARLELGRGSTAEVVQRTEQFVTTITQAASRYGRRPEALVAADLRHADGYAIRLRGVSTVGADAQKK